MALSLASHHALAESRVRQAGADRVLCETSFLDVSPDGAWLVAWSRGNAPLGPGPDFAVLKVDCLLSGASVDACTVAAVESRSPPVQLAWKGDSTALMLLSPGIGAQYLYAPAFSEQQSVRLSAKTKTNARRIRLDGYIEPAEFEKEAFVVDAVNAQAQSAGIIEEIHMGAGATGAGVFLSRDTLEARTTYNGPPLAGGISGASLIDNGKLIFAEGRSYLLAAGKLYDARTGQPVAGGPRYKLSPQGKIAFSTSDLGRYTSFQGGRTHSDAVDMPAGRLLGEYDQSADGKTRALQFIAPASRPAFRIERGAERRDMACGSGADDRLVDIEDLRLGADAHQVDARLFSQKDPAGLVVLAGGGPGATSQGADALRLAKPFLNRKWDVLLVTASGNFGAGRPTVDRLAARGGGAVEDDARAILSGVDAFRGRYARHVFYGESYGGLLGLAVMNKDTGSRRRFDRIMLAAPWLKPRPPQTWLDSRGVSKTDLAVQETWERVAMGIDWSKPNDPFRDWAERQRAAAKCSARLSILHGDADPAFDPSDIPCRPNDGSRFTKAPASDHMTTLAGNADWIARELDTLTDGR
ncbi:alpha/beta hydrolase family protein [Caulobacter endophyticus]|uniref:alpha/beta hydrolase family protein n=1 Tax=Caulobacter endophyticus TaxID=2172652 RepID=UPI00240F975D|nr:hypothetical protein [Caulobacter endophyticus]MDG2531337.1 hypothetical protein [Caulobacter endophyticus]